MFAVIESGGKQYKVAKDDIIALEKIDGKEGAKVKLDSVLMLVDGKKSTIGTPTVKGATVSAEIVSHQRDDKVIVFKKKRRHNYRRKQGHRQDQTVIKVTAINQATAAASSDKKEG